MVSTHLKKISQLGNLPSIGVKIKHISNHHLDILPFCWFDGDDESLFVTKNNSTFGGFWNSKARLFFLKGPLMATIPTHLKKQKSPQQMEDSSIFWIEVNTTNVWNHQIKLKQKNQVTVPVPFMYGKYTIWLIFNCKCRWIYYTWMVWGMIQLCHDITKMPNVRSTYSKTCRNQSMKPQQVCLPVFNNACLVQHLAFWGFTNIWKKNKTQSCSTSTKMHCPTLPTCHRWPWRKNANTL